VNILGLPVQLVFLDEAVLNLQPDDFFLNPYVESKLFFKIGFELNKHIPCRLDIVAVYHVVGDTTIWNWQRCENRLASPGA
jgi:hypothetical protein